MEEKLLRVAIELSIENILKELRKFSSEGLSMFISISTRTKDENTDEYGISIGNTESKDESFLSEGYEVKWHFDPREGEGIREVIPLEGSLRNE